MLTVALDAVQHTLAIAVLADGTSSAGLGSVTLANLGTVAGGVKVTPVDAPESRTRPDLPLVR